VKLDGSYAFEGAKTSGVLIHIRGEVACPATPADNDTLTLVPKELIPPGAILSARDSWIYCETDPGTLLTLDIGMASNPDYLADALSLTVAGTAITGDGTSGHVTGCVTFDRSGTAPAALTDPVAVSTQEDIIATVMVETAGDATVLQFCIAYYASA